MHIVTKVTRRFLIYLTALVLVAGYPLSAMADTQEPTTPVVNTPVVTEQLPVATAPAESQTVAPTTAAVTTPAPTPPPKIHYTYNSTTGHWDSVKWQYNPATGAYEAPPAPIVVPVVPAASSAAPVAPTVIDPKTDTSSADATKTIDTSVLANNLLTSNALSGDGTVANNTTGGNATTGNAAAVATLLNAVNSSVTSGDNQKVASFTQDIMGDVTGDIILYPMLLKAMLEAQAGAPNSTINANTNNQLNNTVDLTAKSGNASVTNNTAAGNATSGSATAVANVVNILNSMIAAQKSFIGTINIYGNLNGDILIAPDFIPQMIANNKSSATPSTQLSSTDSTNIVNNISAVAKSGAATVLDNTSAGSAKSGDANTGVVIFNITGHEIIAKNSLLVFVNVLGKWVGVIVDAPVGATAALIGNGVSSDTTYAPDLKVNSVSTAGITNTISVDAQSGDATVAGNTSAGNATTGQARALANIANISGSQFSASDWFGVLFINVFQNWYGDFGIDTPYGNPTVIAPEPPSPIQFVPKSETILRSRTNTALRVHTQTSSQVITTTDTTTTNTTPDTVAAATLGENATKPVSETPTNAFDFRLIIVAGSVLAIGLSLLGFKRLFS